MSRRLLAPLAAVAALTASAAGCGDEALTKAEYVKEATALCVKHRREISAELDSFAARRGQGDAAGGRIAAEAMEEVILPGFRAQYRELRELPTPPGDEKFLNLMRSKFAASLKRAEERLATLFHVKPSAYSEFAEGTLMTHEYGIEGCGSLRRSPGAIYAAF